MLVMGYGRIGFLCAHILLDYVLQCRFPPSLMCIGTVLCPWLVLHTLYIDVASCSVGRWSYSKKQSQAFLVSVYLNGMLPK